MPKFNKIFFFCSKLLNGRNGPQDWRATSGRRGGGREPTHTSQYFLLHFHCIFDHDCWWHLWIDSDRIWIVVAIFLSFFFFDLVHLDIFKKNIYIWIQKIEQLFSIFLRMSTRKCHNINFYRKYCFSIGLHYFYFIIFLRECFFF